MTNRNVAVVMPAFKVQKEIADVIRSVPGIVQNIFEIDDDCANNSGEVAKRPKKHDNPLAWSK